MSGWPMRYGPRHWAGVPGVRYPEERPVQAEAPEGWLTTAQAAELLHVTAGRAGALLQGAGVAHALAGARGYWEPEGVLRAAAGREPEAQEPPPGWCLAEEACLLLGCCRTTLERRRASWGLATRRVRLRGKIRTLFDRAQAESAARLLKEAEGLMAKLENGGSR